MTYDDGQKVTIVGVSSYGPGVTPFDPYSCKGSGRPDVYARVTTGLDWIKHELTEGCSNLSNVEGEHTWHQSN